MDFNKAQAILKQMEATQLIELKSSLINYAIRYSRLRTDWLMADLKTRKDMEEIRVRAHNALIDSCNILSRNMVKLGEDNFWREQLGEERQEIGDFACYLHCIYGLQAR